MTNLLKKKAKKFNSKKGFTLIELIVAIMIMLIVVSASVRGITISYRSAMLGAAKNDAQSVAQRNCDIIMTTIVSNVEKQTFTAADIPTLGGLFHDHNCNRFSVSYEETLRDEDIALHLPAGGYNSAKYAAIQSEPDGVEKVKILQASNYASDSTKNYQYYTIKKTRKTINGEDYLLFHITTYVFYTEKGFVTCEGEVSVLPKV